MRAYPCDHCVTCQLQSFIDDHLIFLLFFLDRLGSVDYPKIMRKKGTFFCLFSRCSTFTPSTSTKINRIISLLIHNTLSILIVRALAPPERKIDL